MTGATVADPQRGEIWVLQNASKIFSRNTLQPISVPAGTPILILEELETFQADISCYRFSVGEEIADAYIDKRSIIPLDDATLVR